MALVFCNHHCAHQLAASRAAIVRGLQLLTCCIQQEAAKRAAIYTGKHQRGAGGESESESESEEVEATARLFASAAKLSAQ